MIRIACTKTLRPASRQAVRIRYHRPSQRGPKEVSQKVSPEDRQILDEHATLIREMEREFAEGKGRSHTSTPALESGIANQNDTTYQRWGGCRLSC